MGEIHQISRVKSPTLHSSNWRVFAETLAFIILGGFHRWYLGEIHWISGWNLLDFTGEIHWISGWNLLDFKGEIKGEIHQISKDQLPGMVSPMFSFFLSLIYCLPRGRHSEAAHEKRLLCAQKCTGGGVGWGGVVMKGWGGVGGSWRGGVGCVM